MGGDYNGVFLKKKRYREVMTLQIRTRVTGEIMMMMGIERVRGEMSAEGVKVRGSRSITIKRTNRENDHFVRESNNEKKKKRLQAHHMNDKIVAFFFDPRKTTEAKLSKQVKKCVELTKTI